jgi:hypothetical protein
VLIEIGTRDRGVLDSPFLPAVVISKDEAGPMRLGGQLSGPLKGRHVQMSALIRE